MKRRGGYGFLIYVTVAACLALYFAFAAVQGDLGVLKRVQIDAERARLESQRAELAAEVAAMQNRVRRLSDDYLDLDLLDERARAVLGLMRADELVIR